jgi:metal-responsive CopG/Arc/MetJ family transcriptional regulator
MAHIPTPKRKAAVKSAPKLHGLRQPMTITLPPELVAEIDAIAAEEDRSRAKMIEIGMRQFVQAYRHKAAA